MLRTFFSSFSFYLLILTLISSNSYASTQKSKNGWTDHSVSRVSLDDIVDATDKQRFKDVVEATARKQTTKNGSSVVLESVVQETVNRSKVGNVLLKRILGGGLAIGGITALIEGVGWVIEDGAYVKRISPQDDSKGTDQPDPSKQYMYFVYKDGKELYFPDANSCGEYLKDLFNQTAQPSKPERTKYTVLDYPIHAASVVVRIDFYNGYNDKTHRDMHRWPNPNYDPNSVPKDKKLVLTPDLVGDMAVGDYTDPSGDPQYDIKTGVWTGVEQAYQHDPNGVGDEIADAIDQKHENNPEKDAKPKPVPLVFPDGTPNPDAFPVPDVPGAKYPAPDVAPGTEGTTKPDTNPDGTPKTDPDGNPTGTGTFQLPPFCSWATVVCEWLEWTQEDDLPEKEEIEIDELSIEEKQVQVKWQAMCPEASTVNLTIEGFSQDFAILDPQYICAQAPILKPVIIFSATLTALYILFGYGASRGKDE